MSDETTQHTRSNPVISLHGDHSRLCVFHLLKCDKTLHHLLNLTVSPKTKKKTKQKTEQKKLKKTSSLHNQKRQL